MTRFLIPALLAALAAPAAAQDAMSAAEFEAYVTGRTLTYGTAEGPYGVERYHEGRRVTWAFVGGECEAGVWEEREPGMICFSYETLEPDQCWRFYEEGSGLRAEFVNDPAVSYLYEVTEDELALVCPDYGV
ncbi:hypothetical protein [Wenxinia marina]|nr:hypothetical protein [Wenxinia marina]GGL78633.1 hypothetical protein GCM10011392_36400 [Wenxinia marina]